MMKSELNRKRKRVEADQCEDDFKENFHSFSEKEFPRILKENTRTSDAERRLDTQTPVILSRSEEKTQNPVQNEEDEYMRSSQLIKKMKQGDPSSTVTVDHIQTNSAAQRSSISKSFARDEKFEPTNEDQMMAYSKLFTQKNFLTIHMNSHEKIERQKTNEITFGVTPEENTVESYRCLICFQTFSRLSYLKNHTRLSHDLKENFQPFSEKQFPGILKRNTRTFDVASGPDTQSHHLILSRSEEMTHNPGKTEEDYEYTGSAPLTKKSKQGDPTTTVMADHIQTSLAAHPSDISKSFAREENPGLLQKNHLTNLIKSHKETQKTDMNTVGVTPVENIVESYRCLICYRSFPRLNYLKNHTRMSHDKNQHASNKSKKSPSLRNELKLHGSSLTKERLFECGFCGNSFFKSHHRDTHLLIHLGEKHYSCHLCEKSFIQKGNLTAHLKTHIREMSKSEIVDLNRQIGVQLPALAGEKRQESQNIDSNGQRTGVEFFARGKPQKSQNKDENGQNIVEKPHKCSSCPKSFRFPAKLKVHVRVHTGERPYKCSLCSKAYTQSHNLKIHLVTHTGVKPYKCKYCLKLFSYGANLNRHQKTHAEEKLEFVSQ